MGYETTHHVDIMGIRDVDIISNVMWACSEPSNFHPNPRGSHSGSKQIGIAVNQHTWRYCTHYTHVYSDVDKQLRM